jgi:hypothetical protein
MRVASSVPHVAIAETDTDMARHSMTSFVRQVDVVIKTNSATQVTPSDEEAFLEVTFDLSYAIAN